MPPDENRPTLPNLYRQVGAIWLIQLVIVIIPAIDAFLLSGISAVSVAGYALASSFYGLWILGTKGVLQGLSYAVAPHFGQGDKTGTTALFIQSLWLMLLMIIVAWGLLWISGLGIGRLDIGDDLKTLAKQYLYVIAFGVPAVLGIRVLVAYLEAVNLSGVVVKVLWLTLPIKILLGYGCVQGYFGKHWQGTTGTALSTNIYYWLGFMIILALTARHLRPYIRLVSLYETAFYRPNWTKLSQLLHYGLPIAMGYLAEYALFPIIATTLATHDPAMLTAHEILSSVYDVLLSLPIAIMIAMSIWLGQYYQTYPTYVYKISRYAEYVLIGMAGMAGVLIYISHPIWLGRYQLDELTYELVVATLPLFILRGMAECPQSLNAFYLRAVRHGWLAFIFILIGLWGVGFMGIYTSHQPSVGQVWWWLFLAYGVSWLLSRWSVKWFFNRLNNKF